MVHLYCPRKKGDCSWRKKNTENFLGKTKRTARDVRRPGQRGTQKTTKGLEENEPVYERRQRETEPKTRGENRSGHRQGEHAYVYKRGLREPRLYQSESWGGNLSRPPHGETASNRWEKGRGGTTDGLKSRRSENIYAKNGETALCQSASFPLKKDDGNSGVKKRGRREYLS